MVDYVSYHQFENIKKSLLRVAKLVQPDTYYKELIPLLHSITHSRVAPNPGWHVLCVTCSLHPVVKKIFVMFILVSVHFLISFLSGLESRLFSFSSTFWYSVIRLMQWIRFRLQMLTAGNATWGLWSRSMLVTTG